MQQVFSGHGNRSPQAAETGNLSTQTSKQPRNPGGLPRRLGNPLSIVNTRSAESTVFTGLETAWVPSGRSKHYLRGRKRLNGPCERDRSTGKSLFEKGLIIGSILDHSVGHASHFGSDRGECLALAVSIQRIAAEISLVLIAELILAQMDRACFWQV